VRASAVICFALFASALGAQQSHKVGNEFGRSAFLAVRAIQRDRSEQGSDRTREAIDTADADAATKEEIALVEHLRTLFLQHIVNNLRRSLAPAAEQKALNEKENNCFDPLAEALRARTSAVPAACDSI